jgi:hypothetical protein
VLIVVSRDEDLSGSFDGIGETMAKLGLET